MKPNKLVGLIGTVGVPGCYGGFETLAEQLARNISVNEVRFYLYCQRSAYKGVSGRSASFFEGHPRILLPLKANGPSSVIYDALSMLHAVLIARVDVLLVLGYSGAWILPFIKMISPKTRILTNLDGLEWRRDKYGSFAKNVLRFLEAAAVKNSDRVIVDNSALLDIFSAIYPRARPYLISYGGDHTLVPPAIPQEVVIRHDYYLSVARIEPENNCEMILEAFCLAGANTIIFIGNWNSSQYGKDLRARYEGSACVIMLDPVYDINELSYYRCNSVGYVHGHSVGGTNPSLVEAIFHTNNIMAFDCPFNRCTLQGNGKYFDSASGLAALIRVESFIGESHIANIRDNYTWADVSHKYISAIYGNNDESDI